MSHGEQIVAAWTQNIPNKRLVSEAFLAISEGASNAIVATDLPPAVTFAVPICWPALTGAAIDGGNPEILLQSISRYYKFLPGEQQEVFRSEVAGQAS